MRRLIREEAETNMMLRDVDDILDETIMSAAPKIVLAIREREVDEDIDEFVDGALLGGWDANTQSYADPPVVGSDAEVGDRNEVTEMHRLGYDWGWDNPGKVKDENVPDPIRREMVEYALSNFKGRVTEEFVINALETVYDYGKEQMDDVHGILKKAWKRFGWKIAPVLAGVEIFEHVILPGILSTINPAFMILTTVPTIEILAATGLAIAKAIGPDKPEPEHVPGHLDWYEEEGKEMRESKMRITRRQLRRIIRESLEDDPRMKRYNRPRKEPRPGELERTQAIYDKIRKDSPEFAAEWMHDTGKEGQGGDNAYDEGYDDYLHSLGEEDPAMPDNPEYMRGWDSADIDSYKPGGQMHLGADK